MPPVGDYNLTGIPKATWLRRCPIVSLPVNFQADQVSGIASCNNYSGTYQTTANKIEFGPLAVTMMMCEEPTGLMDQETAFLAAMDSATQFRLQGDTLEMLDEQGVTILTFQKSTSE